MGKSLCCAKREEAEPLQRAMWELSRPGLLGMGPPAAVISPCTFSPLLQAWSEVGRRYSLPDLQLKCPSNPHKPMCRWPQMLGSRMWSLTPGGGTTAQLVPSYPPCSAGGRRRGAKWTMRGNVPALPLRCFRGPPEAKPLWYSCPGLPHPLHLCLSGCWRSEVGSIAGWHCLPTRGFLARAGGTGRQGRVGETYPHTNSVATQVQKQGFGPAHFAQLLAVLRTMLFPPPWRPSDPSAHHHHNRQV